MADVITRVTLTTARTVLGDLMKRADRGEVVIITNHGRDHAALVPMRTFETLAGIRKAKR